MELPEESLATAAIDEHSDYGILVKRKEENIEISYAYNEYEKSGNGFSFEKYDSNDLINVLYYACDVYYNRKDDWQMLQTNAMNTDVSWENSANTYSLLYNELMNQ